jgi:hypothetical protein
MRGNLATSNLNMDAVSIITPHCGFKLYSMRNRFHYFLTMEFGQFFNSGKLVEIRGREASGLQPGSTSHVSGVTGQVMAAAPPPRPPSSNAETWLPCLTQRAMNNSSEATVVQNSVCGVGYRLDVF